MGLVKRYLLTQETCRIYDKDELIELLLEAAHDIAELEGELYEYREIMHHKFPELPV